MFRVFAFLASVVAAGTLAGTASAHPPELQGSPYQSYNAAPYSAPLYTGSSYAAPRYSAASYVAPTYSTAPRYSGSYSAPTYTSQTYTAPTYTAPSYPSPTYSAPSYSTAPTYSAPAYQPSRLNYSGYRSPSYGHRYKRSHATYRPAPSYSYGPVVYSRPNFGPYSDRPDTEGLNYGYAGGPTYGNDSYAVINGVRVNSSRAD